GAGRGGRGGGGGAGVGGALHEPGLLEVAEDAGEHRRVERLGDRKVPGAHRAVALEGRQDAVLGGGQALLAAGRAQASSEHEERDAQPRHRILAHLQILLAHAHPGSPNQLPIGKHRTTWGPVDAPWATWLESGWATA